MVIVIFDSIAVIVSTLLILAGVEKFVGFGEFRKLLTQLPKVGPVGQYFAALIMPSLEILIGIVGVLHQNRQTFMAIAFLYLIFSIASAYFLATKKNVACNCYGALSDGKFNMTKLLVNICIFIFFAILSIFNLVGSSGFPLWFKIFISSAFLCVISIALNYKNMDKTKYLQV
jgi:hypothetical protein